MVRRRARQLAALATVGAALVAFPRAARAQPLVERFDPAERGSRFFVADSLELDGHLRFAAGVVTSYGSRLRTFRQQPGDPEQSNLIEHSVWTHAGASLVLAPGARFALDLPIAFQSGNDVALDRRFYPAPRAPRLGDVRASFDLRLAGSARPDIDGAVLAAGVSAYVPTGSGPSYASDDYARVGGRLGTAFRRGSILGAVRVGYMYRQDDLDPFGRVSLGSEANVVLAVGYQVRRLVFGPELYGSTILKDAFERRTTPVELLFGAHFGIGDVQVGLGLGTALVNGLGAPRFRGVVSLEWAPSRGAPHDRDHDGVMDADDMCPDVPGLASGVDRAPARAGDAPSAPVAARGCPAAPMDSDGDGIVDAEDACPDLPGVRSTRDAKAHGCPLPAPVPADPPEDPPPDG